MTTSKILVPAGTNLDGTKDRVPVDIEIPQPLHVVIDGSGDASKSLSIDLRSIITNNDVKAFEVERVVAGFFPDENQEAPTSGFMLTPVFIDETEGLQDFSFALQPSGVFMVYMMLSSVTLQDPGNTHGSVVVEFVDDSLETMSDMSVPVMWTLTDIDSMSCEVRFSFPAEDIPSDAIGFTMHFDEGQK